MASVSGRTDVSVWRSAWRRLREPSVFFKVEHEVCPVDRIESEFVGDTVHQEVNILPFHTRDHACIAPSRHAFFESYADPKAHESSKIRQPLDGPLNPGTADLKVVSSRDRICIIEQR
jgi:hypothetical protein